MHVFATRKEPFSSKGSSYCCIISTWMCIRLGKAGKTTALSHFGRFRMDKECKTLKSVYFVRLSFIENTLMISAFVYYIHDLSQQIKHEINPFSAGIDFTRQNLTSVDVRF